MKAINSIFEEIVLSEFPFAPALSIFSSKIITDIIAIRFVNASMKLEFMLKPKIFIKPLILIFLIFK